MIRFRCECGRQLQADEGQVGADARCPLCNRAMKVPRTGQPAAQAPIVRSGGFEITAPPGDSSQAGKEIRLGRSEQKSFARGEADRIRRTADAALTLGLLGIFCMPPLSPLAVFYGIKTLRLIRTSQQDASEVHSDKMKAIGGIVFGAWSTLGLAVATYAVVLELCS
jgi:hypothetical protein